MAVIRVNTPARTSGRNSVAAHKMAAPEAVLGSAAAPVTTTNAYSGQTSDWVPCDAFQTGKLTFVVTEKDSTTVEIQIDTSPNGSAASPIVEKNHVVGAYTSGTAPSAPGEQQFTLSNYSNGDGLPVKMDLGADAWFRAKVKSTGGAAATKGYFIWRGGVL